jgi:crotonobetainyl-CoA:carnitine CoA-transferase CaiB-like acyl-CoA transferase
VAQVVAHEQTRAMGMILDAPDDKLTLMALPFKINGWRPGFGSVAPDLGADQATHAPESLEEAAE